MIRTWVIFGFGLGSNGFKIERHWSLKQSLQSNSADNVYMFKRSGLVTNAAVRVVAGNTAVRFEGRFF